ncbi:MAG: GTPase Era [Sporocytophaga sp.]|uniref:GTPase Era n=1 Tax=Sporocytophaga sp. TaxID=2231183 RepID=UPI001B1CEAA7|nr:GTPase Era [Sporocytophaga sp.]MBO9701939.1 GTPase Era [Sporocytophaga sp.]
MSEAKSHKAGFVSIVGKPNVGKSTLMNALIGERLSIITSKAQTTRHRIMGILNGDDFQIVYSDTPGILNPQYELHKAMMGFVTGSLQDADIILFVTDIYEKEEEVFEITEKIKKMGLPIIVIVNKVDQIKSQEELKEKLAYWATIFPAKEVLPVSALEKFNLELLFNTILENLPVHPPYYGKDELTDRPERFFAAEILREKILLNYKKEVPYSCEVIISEFKEKEDLISIRADILVERDSQKGIIIGHKGAALKKTGTQAREEMEKFFAKKVFLEQHVKVEPEWRTKADKLKRFGYLQ